MTDKLIAHFEKSLIDQGLREVQEGDEVGAMRVIKKSRSLAPMWAGIADQGLIKRPQEEDPS